MECKYKKNLFFMSNPIELIDTLWNVNESGETVDEALVLELIDTLWNVNNPTCAIPIIA